MTPEQFTASWRSLVAAWEVATQHSRRSADALLTRAVRSGLQLASEPPTSPSVESLLTCEVKVIGKARVMHKGRYARANQDLKVLRDKEMDPIEHYCQIGWRWLRNPRADFDVWWYWSEHLDPRADDINPLLFHALVGRRAGLATAPPDREAPRPPTRLPSSGVRRVCLYAAYDVDGVVDDYVLDYLRELSRHADVYYLADGVMSSAELAKLSDLTVGAWAIPHGRYDFGSYSLLASELVGWETIEQYDEMLFANDSCYLLRSLDEVFARMGGKAADWWGLQATKMDFSRSEGHSAPIHIAEAKRFHTDVEAWNPHYRTHLSSYLLSFRRPVFTDPGFRRRLEAVVKQEFKDQVILKYEIGISDYLIDAGFDFDTFIPFLYPFHPLYSADYFDLVEQGFPLLKRNFIGEPTATPDLVRWKERILELVPDARVDVFEHNLRRVAPADAMFRTSRVLTGPDGLVDYDRALNRKEMRVEDRVAPRFDHWWAFAVSPVEHVLTGNERAIFDEVRDDPSIKKIVLTRSREIDLDGENVVLLPLSSRIGQEHLARSGQVFVRHNVDLTFGCELSMEHHRVIDVGHGLPRPSSDPGRVKDVLSPQRRPRVRRERHVIITDRDGRDAPVGESNDVEVWATGQPRHSLLLRPESALPKDLTAELDDLRSLTNGRRLLLWLPSRLTSLPGLGPDKIAEIAHLARRNNLVLGVRFAADAVRFKNLDPLFLTTRRFPNAEVLIRQADLMVTDDSHLMTDRAMTGRAMAVLDPRAVLAADSVPGSILRTGDELMTFLDLEPHERVTEPNSASNGRLTVGEQAPWHVVQHVRRQSLSDPAGPPAVRVPRG